MPKLPDSIESKRGKERLRRSSEKIVTRTLKLCDLLWKKVHLNDKATHEQILSALRAYQEILPYVAPKLSALDISQTIDLGDNAEYIYRLSVETRRLAGSQPLLTEVIDADIISETELT